MLTKAERYIADDAVVCYCAPQTSVGYCDWIWSSSTEPPRWSTSRLHITSSRTAPYALSINMILLIWLAPDFVPPPPSREEIDVMRHREITSKAVSAVLVLMLKWYKASRQLHSTLGWPC